MHRDALRLGRQPTSFNVSSPFFPSRCVEKTFGSLKNPSSSLLLCNYILNAELAQAKEKKTKYEKVKTSEIDKRPRRW